MPRHTHALFFHSLYHTHSLIQRHVYLDPTMQHCVVDHKVPPILGHKWFRSFVVELSPSLSNQQSQPLKGKKEIRADVKFEEEEEEL